MNHQRFKFYHHSTEYYRQLYNSIKQLEDSCKDINIQYYHLLLIINVNQNLLKVIVIQINYIRRLVETNGESYEIHNHYHNQSHAT